MFGQTTKAVTYEESIKIEIMARKHAKEDINIFINKKKYYFPERRISDFNQNYNQKLYNIYKDTNLKKIESVKKGKKITKFFGVLAGGTLLAIFVFYVGVFGFDSVIDHIF